MKKTILSWCFVMVLLGGAVLQVNATSTQIPNPTNTIQGQPLLSASTTGTPSPIDLETLQPIGVSSLISTVGWITSGSTDYISTIAYPPTVQFRGNDVGYSLAKVPLCNVEYCLYLLPTNTYPETLDTGFIGASIAISILNLDLQDCTNFKDIQVQRIRHLKINGMNYSAVDTENTGLPYNRKDVHYRTFARSTCFDLTTSIATTVGNAASTGTPQVKPFTETDERKVQAILDTIVSTFKLPPYPQQATPTEAVAVRATATSTPISTNDWKIYTNATYGLSIPYPPTMQVETAKDTNNAANPGVFGPGFCDPFQTIGLEPAVLLACFDLGKGTYPETTYTDFLGASMAVIIPNLSQQHCTFMEDGSIPVQKTSLNGNIFFFTERSGVAAGLYDHFLNYRTYVQNMCLEFDITIASASYSENGGTAWRTPILPFTEGHIRSIFDRMISTFHFTPPQPSISTTMPFSTANWRTYTNSDYGVSIAYPPATMQSLGNGNTVGRNLGPTPLCNNEYLGANFFQDINPQLINCFYLPPNTYPDTTNTHFIDASFAISVFNLNLYDCVAFKDIEFQQFHQFSINGRIFASFESYSANELYQRYDVHNRTFIHNTCFDFTTTLVVNADFEQAIRFTESNRRNIQAIFDQMLSTLRFSSPSQPNTVRSINSFPQATTAGWSTYTDSTYPISIAFPAAMDLYYGENASNLSPQSFRCNVYSANYDTDPIVCFDLPKGAYPETTNTDFEAASLLISVYHYDQQACLSFEDTYFEGNPPWIKTGIINGMTYSAIGIETPDSAQSAKTVRYRTFAQNTCFDITISIGINESLLSTPAMRPLTDADQHNIQGILNQMVLTFHVTESAEGVR